MGEGPGRPAIGPAINVRLPEWLIEKLDQMADAAGVSRALLVRCILEDGVQEFNLNGLVGR